VDVSAFDGALRRFLNERARQSPPPRYLGIGLSSVSQSDLHTIKTKLVQLVQPDAVWEAPGHGGAPEAPISRNEFCRRLFSNEYKNVVVYLPEDWMFGWSESDRRVFWSTLACAYGRNRVYVVFSGTASTLSNVDSYLHRSVSLDSGIHIYTSKHERSA
jgi:hypothetical protein